MNIDQYITPSSNNRMSPRSSTLSKDRGISYASKILNPKVRIAKRQNSNSISTYQNNDKIEYLFSEKIKDLIKSDENVKGNAHEILSNSSKDKWKPEGYIYYEFLRKHPIFFNSDVLIDSSDKTLPSIKKYQSPYRSKEEEEKERVRLHLYDHLRTLKPKDEKNEELGSIRYTESDVLNVKNAHPSLERIGEKHLFNPQLKGGHFTTTTMSESEWLPRNTTKPIMNNYSSVKYNIIAPTIKSMFITKDDVNNVSNNYYKIHSLSQFNDMTRVSAPNHTKKFIDSYHKDNNCFHLSNAVVANYGDMHHSYKELFPQTFWTK